MTISLCSSFLHNSIRLLFKVKQNIGTRAMFFQTYFSGNHSRAAAVKANAVNGQDVTWIIFWPLNMINFIPFIIY